MLITLDINFIIAVNLYPFGASDVSGHDFSHLAVVRLTALSVESAEGRTSWRLDDERCTFNEFLSIIFDFYHVFSTLRWTLLVAIFIFHLMLNLENNLLAVSR